MLNHNSNISEFRKQLVAELKEYRANGYTLEIKLTASLADIEREIDRIVALQESGNKEVDSEEIDEDNEEFESVPETQKIYRGFSVQRMTGGEYDVYDSDGSYLDTFQTEETAKQFVDNECDCLALENQNYQEIEEFESETEVVSTLNGQYCDILDSPNYIGQSCLIDPNLRVHYVTSAYNFPCQDKRNYWREFHHAYQYSLLMMRQRQKTTNKTLTKQIV